MDAVEISHEAGRQATDLRIHILVKYKVSVCQEVAEHDCTLEDTTSLNSQ